MTEQERILELLRFYEEMELRLEQSRAHLTPLEALYVEKVIEFRRDQLLNLAEACRMEGPMALLKRQIAASMAGMAGLYERKLVDGEEDDLTKLLRENL